MRQRSAAPTTDYSGYFLVAILLGIVLVVLGITMAVAQSGSRLLRVDERPVSTSVVRIGKALKPAMTAHRTISRRMEPFHGG